MEKQTERPQPRLIILSAPSGAGKTTLCKKLLTDFPDRIRKSISTTTRPKRPDEVDGRHYHFVTVEEFEKRVTAQSFAEWAHVHENRYGTLKSNIEAGLKSGTHLLFDIDVQGAMGLKKIYGARTLLIFILPPSMEELRQRLQARAGDTPASIETRLRNAYNEVGWSGKFDYQILNQDLDRAYQELKDIIQRECR